jgi:hypothetical protein
MTQFEPQTNDTGVAVFYIKYRKTITVLCIILLLYFPIEIYNSHADLNSGSTFRVIGFLLGDVLTYLAIPIGTLIYMRKVTKAYFKERALIEQKLKDKEANV